MGSFLYNQEASFIDGATTTTFLPVTFTDTSIQQSWHETCSKEVMENLEKLKACTKCKKEKAFEEFHINRQSKTGRQFWCKECASSQFNRATKLKRDRRRGTGICINCNRASIPNGDTCLICRLRVVCAHTIGSGNLEAVKIVIEKFSSQDSKCPYTGISLELGVNAEFDHILPKKRFPELAHDLNNLEWVYGRINRMKSDLTKEEFIEMCRLVTEYTSGKGG